MGAVKADVQVFIIFNFSNKTVFCRNLTYLQEMEMKVKQQAFSLQSQSSKMQVKLEIEKDAGKT